MLHIFLTDLQAYNEGSLVGKWLELPLSDFELQQALSEVLCEGETACGTENHEEFFITDYEWDEEEFFEVGEYEDLYKLNEKIQELDECDNKKEIAFLLRENLVRDIEEAKEKADEVIIYENQKMEDIAYEMMQEQHNADALPSLIANNIDYEGIGQELEMEGTYYEVGRDIYEYRG